MPMMVIRIIRLFILTTSFLLQSGFCSDIPFRKSCTLMRLPLSHKTIILQIFHQYNRFVQFRFVFILLSLRACVFILLSLRACTGDGSGCTFSCTRDGSGCTFSCTRDGPPGVFNFSNPVGCFYPVNKTTRMRVSILVISHRPLADISRLTKSNISH